MFTLSLFVCCLFFFFFNDTATTEIYTLSLHDALPILAGLESPGPLDDRGPGHQSPGQDRKSTRLNSSHQIISYAVFCLKKKTRTVVAAPGQQQLERVLLHQHVVVQDHYDLLRGVTEAEVSRATEFFFFNDTATTEIYTLSLHDALPILRHCASSSCGWMWCRAPFCLPLPRDRKSTRLNSSHQIISYAVFCLKKKNI